MKIAEATDAIPKYETWWRVFWEILSIYYIISNCESSLGILYKDSTATSERVVTNFRLT